MDAQPPRIPQQRSPAGSGDAGDPGVVRDVDPEGISLRPDGDREIVTLTGELDIATAHQLQPVVNRLLAGGRTNITLDLADVSFLDGFALRELIAVHRDIDSAGGTLQIIANRRVVRLFELTGLTTLLACCTTDVRLPGSTA
jgi:anti-sigma B factor antagonist